MRVRKCEIAKRLLNKVISFKDYIYIFKEHNKQSVLTWNPFELLLFLFNYKNHALLVQKGHNI